MWHTAGLLNLLSLHVSFGSLQSLILDIFTSEGPEVFTTVSQMDNTARVNLQSDQRPPSSARNKS